MKRTIVGTLLATGIALAPGFATAQTATIPANEATMICRVATATETPNAQTMGAQTQRLVCRNIQVVVEPTLKVVGSVTVNAASSAAPPFPGLTGAPLSKAWLDWFTVTMSVPPPGS